MENRYKHSFLKLCQIFLIGCRCVLWLDHPNSWMCQFNAALMVCLVLSSCTINLSIKLLINADQFPCPCWGIASSKHNVASALFHQRHGMFRMMFRVSFLPHFTWRPKREMLVWSHQSTFFHTFDTWQTKNKTSYSSLSTMACFLLLLCCHIFLVPN